MNIISGKCVLIQDSRGQNYLGVDISEKEYQLYQSFMLQHNFSEEVSLKLARDRGHYHITLINAVQWGSICKKGLDLEILNEVEGKNFTFEVGGIGSAEKENNKTYFVIAENRYLSDLREKYSLGPHDFHMTLAFKEKDVFGVPKNKESCIFPNTAILEFCQNNLAAKAKAKL